MRRFGLGVRPEKSADSGPIQEIVPGRSHLLNSFAALATDDVVTLGADDDIGSWCAQGLEAGDGHHRGRFAETGRTREPLLGRGELLGRG